VEAPYEINDNDHVLENQYWAKQKSQAIQNATAFLPPLCFSLYLQNYNLTTIHQDLQVFLDLFRSCPSACYTDEVVTELLAAETADADGLFRPEVIEQVNATHQYEFLRDCGVVGRQVVNAVFDSGEENVAAAANGLSFNWIRCYEDAPYQKRHQRDFRGGTNITKEQRTYDGQSTFYTRKWNEDRKAILEAQYQLLLDSGMNETEASQNASATAASEATGGKSLLQIMAL